MPDDDDNDTRSSSHQATSTTPPSSMTRTPQHMLTAPRAPAEDNTNSNTDSFMSPSNNRSIMTNTAFMETRSSNTTTPTAAVPQNISSTASSSIPTPARRSLLSERAAATQATPLRSNVSSSNPSSSQSAPGSNASSSSNHNHINAPRRHSEAEIVFLDMSQQQGNQNNKNNSTDEDSDFEFLRTIDEDPLAEPTPPESQEEEDRQERHVYQSADFDQFSSRIRKSTMRRSSTRRKVSFGVSLDSDEIVESLDLLLVAEAAGSLGSSSSLNDSMASVASPGSFIGGNHSESARDSRRRGILASDSPSIRYLPQQSDRISKRISLIADLETGKTGVRGHRAKLRHTSTAGRPQSRGARRRRGVRNIRKRIVNPFWGGVVEESKNSDDEHDADDDQSSDDMSKDSHVSLHGRLMVNRVETIEDSDENNSFLGDESVHMPSKRPQYRLEAIDGGSSTFGGRANGWGIRGNLNLAIYENTVRKTDDCGCFGFKPNALVVAYLSWAFRSSFLAVIMSACFAFFFMTFLFAIFIMLLGFRRPDCVHVNGQDFGTGGANFLDAYALSWTTFSTVGYGLVYPGTSNVSENIKACTGITILATLESFVGILFGSMWGAIFFAKVSRAASVAQVEFSSPMVIKYGAGVLNQEESSNSSSDNSSDSEVCASDSNFKNETGTMPSPNCQEEEEEQNHSHQQPKEQQGPNGRKFKPSKFRCPILEFRILNVRSGQHGGEIIDASMNIVASLDESQASRALKNAVRGPRRKGKKGKRRGVRRRVVRNSLVVPTAEDLDRASGRLEALLEENTRADHQAIEEDPTGRLIPKRIFSKIDIESQEHPFFKRLWLARHVLDENSPLVKQDAKELIRLNGGHWPAELNSAEGVRASFHFHKIIVSLSGTSNADANSVYAQKVYDYEDLCVGYRFCDILFRETDGTIGVDHSLLNDIREQRGGGGEDLLQRPTTSSRSHKEIFVI